MIMPADIIANARAEGIELAITSAGGLTFRGPRAATYTWVPILRSTRAGIVAYLGRAQRGTCDAADWRLYYDERAGILELDGGLLRSDAHARAFAFCLSLWLNQHPFASDARECAACGGSDASDVLVPYGTTATGHTWLHSRCWPAWHLARTTEAETALRQLGVPTPNAKASS